MGDTLVRKNLITELQYLEALSTFYHIPFQPNLTLEGSDTTFTETIPIQFLRKYQMVPIAPEIPEDADDAQPVEKKIAVTEPINFHAVDDLVQLLKWDDYTLVLSTKSQHCIGH